MIRNTISYKWYRVGTPAVTSRGMKEQEMEEIAELINETLEKRENKIVLEGIKKKVKVLCEKFPLYEQV